MLPAGRAALPDRQRAITGHFRSGVSALSFRNPIETRSITAVIARQKSLEALEPTENAKRIWALRAVVKRTALIWTGFGRPTGGGPARMES